MLIPGQCSRQSLAGNRHPGHEQLRSQSTNSSRLLLPCATKADAACRQRWLAAAYASLLPTSSLMAAAQVLTGWTWLPGSFLCCQLGQPSASSGSSMGAMGRTVPALQAAVCRVTAVRYAVSMKCHHAAALQPAGGAGIWCTLQQPQSRAGLAHLRPAPPQAALLHG